MSDDLLIHLNEVTAGHTEKTVLKAVTWSVRRGDAWYVVGRNGAGKSTLLATALGRLPTQSGQLYHHPNLRVGSVPQYCGLVRELPVTVAEFVGLGLLNVVRTQRAMLVQNALASCGLKALADSQVWRVSGGERRRAMIARALALQPNLLALDEPSAGLDVTAERDLMMLLRRLRNDGVTVICITHDLQLAATQASHVAVIANGTLREVAPLQVLDPQLLGLALSVAPA